MATGISYTGAYTIFHQKKKVLLPRRIQIFEGGQHVTDLIRISLSFLRGTAPVV